jgi:hypothetical protein
VTPLEKLAAIEALTRQYKETTEPFVRTALFEQLRQIARELAERVELPEHEAEMARLLHGCDRRGLPARLQALVDYADRLAARVNEQDTERAKLIESLTEREAHYGRQGELDAARAIVAVLEELTGVERT